MKQYIEKRSNYILFAIILLGITVRMIGVDFGLPFLCHNDEPVVVNYALAYGTGDFNPHFFKVPPLLSYMLFFVYGIFFVIGRLCGYFVSISDFGYRFLSDPTMFYVIGRVFTGVFFGSSSIFLIFLLSKKVFDERTGLISALFLAFNFMHVRDSHYIYFDIPLVFFTLLFFISLHYVFKYAKLKYYLLSGFVLGVAVSMKYSAIILLMPAFMVSVISVLRRELKTSTYVYYNICALFMMLAGLFITNPFMFLDYGFFMDTMSRMPFFRPDFWFHIKVSLLGGIGVPMAIAAVAGILLSVVRKNVYAVVIFIFLIVYYAVLTISSQNAERYVFPMLPLCVMFAAYSISAIPTRLREKRPGYLISGILCVILLWPSLIRLYHSERLFLSEDTRKISYDWAMNNIPEGTKIAIDSTGSVFPDLPQKKALIRESREHFNNPKFDTPEQAIDYKTGLILENPYYPDKDFYVYYIKTGPSNDRFLKTYPEIYLDLDAMEDLGIEYVFISTILLNKSGVKLLTELNQKAVLIAEFTPYGKESGEVAPEEETVVPGAPFSLRELARRERTGPVILVYRLQNSNKQRNAVRLSDGTQG